MDEVTQDVEDPTDYERLRDFLKREWPTMRVIGVILALLALIPPAASATSSFRQTRLLATQIANELSQPVLEGRAFYRAGSREGLERTGNEMIDELFAAVFELSMNNPDVPYSQLVGKVLPITRSIPPAPVEVSATVKNTGTDIATEVSVSVDWAGEITRVDVDGLSEWQIIDGGIGEESVVVSIERISKGETVQVLVEYASTRDAIDTVELRVGHPDAAGLPFLPVFTIIPGEPTPSYDLIVVRVSSNETAVQQVNALPAEPFLMISPELLEEFWGYPDLFKEPWGPLELD